MNLLEMLLRIFNAVVANLTIHVSQDSPMLAVTNASKRPSASSCCHGLVRERLHRRLVPLVCRTNKRSMAISTTSQCKLQVVCKLMNANLQEIYLKCHDRQQTWSHAAVFIFEHLEHQLVIKVMTLQLNMPLPEIPSAFPICRAHSLKYVADIVVLSKQAPPATKSAVTVS